MLIVEGIITDLKDVKVKQNVNIDGDFVEKTSDTVFAVRYYNGYKRLIVPITKYDLENCQYIDMQQLYHQYTNPNRVVLTKKGSKMVIIGYGGYLL